MLNNSINSNKANIFKQYKLIDNHFNLKRKEHKMFKIFLAQKIITQIVFHKRKLDDILKIINKSKNAKSLHFYENTIHYYAQIYSICKFNKNKTYLLIKENPDINYCINTFLLHLYKEKQTLDLLINYLFILFK